MNRKLFAECKPRDYDFSPSSWKAIHLNNRSMEADVLTDLHLVQKGKLDVDPQWAKIVGEAIGDELNLGLCDRVFLEPVFYF